MENKNGVWSEEEVKTLFKFVEIKKREGYALVKIFKLFADKVGRKPNSVRNYYYKEVVRLMQDEKRCKKLSIKISEHKVLSVEPFSQSDENMLKQEVDKLIEQGNSVRRACLILANGDATKMIRIQNKYRSLKNKNKKEEITNIIKMPIKRNTLSNEDINALFLGLLKLVKKQEFEKAKLMYEENLFNANNKLKGAIEGLIEKENKIEQLKKQIILLQSNVETLKKKVDKNSKMYKEKSAKKLLNDYFDSESLKREELTLEKNI